MTDLMQLNPFTLMNELTNTLQRLDMARSLNLDTSSCRVGLMDIRNQTENLIPIIPSILQLIRDTINRSNRCLTKLLNANQ